MKLQKLFVIVIVALLFGFKSNGKEVIIKGKINGKIPEKLEYSNPVNGVCFLGFRKLIQPDSTGNFLVKVTIDQPTFLQLVIPGFSNKTLILEPGENYEVKIDLNAKEENFKLSAKNEKGVDLYNTFPNPVHIQVGARIFLKDSVASVIQSKIEDERNKEISSLQKLFQNGDISEGFFRLVRADRECYYAAIQGTVAYIKYCQGLFKPNWLLPEEMKKMWSEAFISTNFSNSELFCSPWAYSLAENRIFFKIFTDENFDLEKYKENRNMGIIYTQNIELSKKELTGNLLEYYNAVYLYTQCVQKLYEKELVPLFNQFKKDYPQSLYTQFLEPEVAPIIDYHKKAEMPLSDKSKIMVESANFSSLKEVLQQFKEKRMYIDVWATWCGPCKAEFTHKEELLKLLQAYNIEVLYISIDKNDRDKQWKEMIKYYGLEGYHLRASEELVTDLRRIFGQNGSISIPWYILVDENGNIVKEHAKAPSQIKELEKQIIDN